VDRAQARREDAEAIARLVNAVTVAEIALLPTYEIVVHGWSWLQTPTPSARQHRADPVLATEPMDAILARPDASFGVELVGDEPVTEDRIVGVDLTRGIDEVGIGPVPGADGVGFHL